MANIRDHCETMIRTPGSPILLVKTLVALLLVATIPRCAVMNENQAAVFVDPGKIIILSCPQIAVRLKTVVRQERKLRGLIDRASVDEGGTVVAAFAYKPDYLQALGQRKLLIEEARKKNCTLPPELQVGVATDLPPPLTPPPATPVARTPASR
jgi:hypothetical protein